MGYLRGELAQHVAADRISEKCVARAPEDRDEPRQHQNQKPCQAPYRAHPPQPDRRAVEDRKHRDGQPDKHQDQRPLEQNAAGQRGPENRRRVPWRMRRILAALPGQIHPRHRAHCGGDGEQQHRIGLRQPRFATEQDAAADHQRGQGRPAPCDEGERGPVGQQNRADRADQGGRTVKPDAQLRPRQAQL